MSEALAGLRGGAEVERVQEPAGEPGGQARPGDVFEVRYRGEPVREAEARDAVRSQIVAKGLRRLLDRGN